MATMLAVTGNCNPKERETREKANVKQNVVTGRVTEDINFCETSVD